MNTHFLGTAWIHGSQSQRLRPYRSLSIAGGFLEWKSCLYLWFYICFICLDKRLTNFSPWAKSSSMPIFVNKILLGHNHIYCHSCLLMCFGFLARMSVLSHSTRESTTPGDNNIYHLAIYRKPGWCLLWAPGNPQCSGQNYGKGGEGWCLWKAGLRSFALRPECYWDFYDRGPQTLYVRIT